MTEAKIIELEIIEFNVEVVPSLWTETIKAGEPYMGTISRKNRKIHHSSLSVLARVRAKILKPFEINSICLNDTVRIENTSYKVTEILQRGNDFSLTLLSLGGKQSRFNFKKEAVAFVCSNAYPEGGPNI